MEVKVCHAICKKNSFGFVSIYRGIETVKTFHEMKILLWLILIPLILWENKQTNKQRKKKYVNEWIYLEALYEDQLNSTVFF